MPSPTAEFERLTAAGLSHLSAWRLTEAVDAFEAAVRLRPDCAEAHYRQGEALFLQRRLDRALACHAAAVRCGIDRDIGGRGRAMSGMVPGDFAWMSHMLRGDLTRAWRLADRERGQRRRAGTDCSFWPRHMRPVWNGAALAGAHVLVRCHHGLGDTIQFIRYAPMLAELARAVDVEAQPELVPLLSGFSGIHRLHALPATTDRPISAFGCEVEIDVTELAHACRTTLDTIPARVPYLAPDPVLAAEASRRLHRIRGAEPRRLAVGLVWAAGAWKPERSVPLSRLAPLADIPGVALVNLQRGPEHAGRRDFGGNPPMAEIFSSDDLAEAAATIANLDLVVTVDTMAAHLAGALGVPTWLMLHVAADWRWLLDRADSPWYPTMRLFRQREPGDWDPVIAEVLAALCELAGAAPRSPPSPEPVRGAVPRGNAAPQRQSRLPALALPGSTAPG